MAKLKFYFAYKPAHKQALVWNPFTKEEIPVDHQMAPLLELLWSKGIITEASCQGCGRAKNPSRPENRGYIKFYRARDARRISGLLQTIPHMIEATYPNGKAVIRFLPKHLKRIEKILRGRFLDGHFLGFNRALREAAQNHFPKKS